MSVPVSLRCGPFTPTVLVKKYYLIHYLFIMWVSLVSVFVEFWLYWSFFYIHNELWFWILFPLLVLVMYVTAVFVSLITAKILLVIASIFHKPREGVFMRDKKDRDYRYWSLRNTIKRWPIWLSHKFPFPFLDNICLKMFGVKTTFANSLFEGYIDTEFMEFGNNVVVGQSSLVQSSILIGHLLIIKKTIIGDDVSIGVHSIVMPGTIMGNKSVLATMSTTTVGQVLEEGYIYVGLPANKYKKNVFFEDGLEDVLGHVEDVEGLREKYEEMYTKRLTEHMTHKERHDLKLRELERQRKHAGA